MFKVIRFSDEHIHIVQKHGRGAQAHLKVNCVMSRNWNRCTAPEIGVGDWPDLDPSQNRSYYDGGQWTKVNVSDFDYCPECQ